jgi:hypothetical protein
VQNRRRRGWYRRFRETPRPWPRAVCGYPGYRR